MPAAPLSFSEPILRPRHRLVEGCNSSSDEGQTTDGEADAESDRESSGGAWWGGLNDTGEVEVEVEVAGGGGTADEIEARKQRIAGTEKLRRSTSSSPTKLRVRTNTLKFEEWWILQQQQQCLSPGSKIEPHVPHYLACVFGGVAELAVHGKEDRRIGHTSSMQYITDAEDRRSCCHAAAFFGEPSLIHASFSLHQVRTRSNLLPGVLRSPDPST